MKDETMTNAEIIHKLIEARQRLARGWCQDFARWKGSVCLFASLWSNDSFGDLQVICALARAIKPDLNPYRREAIGILVFWNNEPGRTQEQVLDLVDRTIASLMKLKAAAVAETREELVEA